MKMRKKLAALLAAAMIASVMPMTAFAATDNRVVTPVRVAKDKTTQGNAPEIVIHNDKGDVDGATGDFYLVLEGAEFLTAGAILYSLDNPLDPVGQYDENDTRLTSKLSAGYYRGPDFKFRVDSKTEMAIEIESTTLDNVSGKQNFPIIAKVTDDVATVSIDSNDTPVGDSGSTVKKHVFARSSDAITNVTVADPTGIYTGKRLPISKFTITESSQGAMFGTDAADAEIVVELDSVDYEFVEDIEVAYRRGFAGKTKTSAPLTVRYGGTGSRVDKQSLVISFDPADFAGGRGFGELEIELFVNSIARAPEVGELKAEISGEIVSDATFVVANVAEFGVEIKADKDYDFVAGQDEKVVFHLNEIVDDSMVTGRTTEFRLPKGVYFTEKDTTVNGRQVGNADVKLTDKADRMTDLAPIRDKDGRIEGFTAKFAVDNTKIDKFKFEANIDITAAYTGDVTLKVEGRSIGTEVEAKLAKTVAPVKVTMEPVKVKPGFKVQTGGKVVIEETDKARLMQGKEIVIALEDDRTGIEITNAKVTVTKGDLRTDDIEVIKKDGELRINVKRRSKEASTIEITELELRLDRSVAQGLYELNVGGPAISELAIANTTAGTTGKVYDLYNEAKIKPVLTHIGNYGNDFINGKDFAIVGDPITGVKSEVVFTIGSNKFLLDGVEESMDASAYIKDGRTMVPVRYLAYALGIEEEAIKFNSGIVTIFVGNGNVVQLQVGSKNLVTNGMSIPMVAAAEIIEGRTYVPVTEIGGVFGVTGTWDAATQTATFK